MALSVETSSTLLAPYLTAVVAEHVVAHRLEDVRLHQGYVLVRRGVHHVVGTVLRKDLGQAPGVGDVADHWQHGHRRMRLLQLQVHEVQITL